MDDSSIASKSNPKSTKKRTRPAPDDSSSPHERPNKLICLAKHASSIILIDRSTMDGIVHMLTSHDIFRLMGAGCHRLTNNVCLSVRRLAHIFNGALLSLKPTMSYAHFPNITTLSLTTPMFVKYKQSFDQRVGLESLPQSLTSLSIRGSGTFACLAKAAEAGFSPVNLQTLNLCETKRLEHLDDGYRLMNHHSTIVTVLCPRLVNLKRLSIIFHQKQGHIRLNMGLPRDLPPTLTFLRLPDGINICTIQTLPPSLDTLIISTGTPSSIVLPLLPKSIKTLNFAKSDHTPFRAKDAKRLPPSLTSLTLGIESTLHAPFESGFFSSLPSTLTKFNMVIPQDLPPIMLIAHLPDMGDYPLVPHATRFGPHPIRCLYRGPTIESVRAQTMFKGIAYDDECCPPGIKSIRGEITDEDGESTHASQDQINLIIKANRRSIAGETIDDIDMLAITVTSIPALEASSFIAFNLPHKLLRIDLIVKDVAHPPTRIGSNVWRQCLPQTLTQLTLSNISLSKECGLSLLPNLISLTLSGHLTTILDIYKTLPNTLQYLSVSVDAAERFTNKKRQPSHKSLVTNLPQRLVEMHLSTIFIQCPDITNECLKSLPKGLFALYLPNCRIDAKCLEFLPERLGFLELSGIMPHWFRDDRIKRLQLERKAKRVKDDTLGQ